MIHPQDSLQLPVCPLQRSAPNPDLEKRCPGQWIRECASGAIGAPNARAETGRPATRPSPAAPNPTEPSGPMGDARASHRFQLDMPRCGHATAQLNRVKSERSTGRMNSAAVYAHPNRDGSAMAAGRHGGHAPVSVELGRNCGRSGIDDCGSGRQSEGAHMIANHGSPHTRCTARQFELSRWRARRDPKLGSLRKSPLTGPVCSDHRLLEPAR